MCNPFYKPVISCQIFTAEVTDPNEPNHKILIAVRSNLEGAAHSRITINRPCGIFFTDGWMQPINEAASYGKVWWSVPHELGLLQSQPEMKHQWDAQQDLT